MRSTGGGAAACGGSMAGFSLKATSHVPIMVKLISLLIVMDKSAAVPRAAPHRARQQADTWLAAVIITRPRAASSRFQYLCCRHTCLSCPGAGWRVEAQHGNKNLWETVWSCRWDDVNLYDAKLCRCNPGQQPPPPFVEASQQTEVDVLVMDGSTSGSHRFGWHTNL